MQAGVGDKIEVLSVRAGQATHRGTVKEVVSTDPHELRVEWDDGHESVFFPAGGMVRVVGRAEG